MTPTSGQHSLSALGSTDREHALAAAALRFRRAVERYVAAAGADNVLHGFPAGTCKHTSVLLARYLDGLGFATAALVANGHRNEHDEVRGFETHAWLRVEGWHVDITADQFPDAPGAVIVTRESPFLATFHGRGEYPKIATFQWKPEHEARLVAAYEGILHHLAPEEL
jgi:hypothetical protein